MLYRGLRKQLCYTRVQQKLRLGSISGKRTAGVYTCCRDGGEINMCSNVLQTG